MILHQQNYFKTVSIRVFFDYVVASDTFPAQKPDKRIVESFCERFHLEACEVAVVGDTPTDLYLAKMAVIAMQLEYYLVQEIVKH